jgi:hypothetical protein
LEPNGRVKKEGSFSGYTGCIHYGGLVSLINIAGFDTDFEKMPRHGFFYDPLIPVEDSGQPDEKTVFSFPDNIQVFVFTFPAFDAVPFHISIIGTKVSPTLALP